FASWPNPMPFDNAGISMAPLQPTVKTGSSKTFTGPSAGVPHQEGYTERTQRAVEENEVDAQELGFSAARSDAKFTTAASPGDHHSGATDGDKPVGGDGAQIAGDVE
ncbi:hypothetical protein APUTEX25_003230, partial [Auxenochlorella protothecoides]